MTTEEKLKHFNTVILESTQSQCDMELEEYKAGLNKYFEEHKEEAIKQKKLEESMKQTG